MSAFLETAVKILFGRRDEIDAEDFSVEAVVAELHEVKRRSDLLDEIQKALHNQANYEAIVSQVKAGYEAVQARASIQQAIFKLEKADDIEGNSPLVGDALKLLYKALN